MVFSRIMAQGNNLASLFNYEIVRGNELWRFGLMMLIFIVVLFVGRVAQFTLKKYAEKLLKKNGENTLTLVLNSLINPIYVAVFAAGVYFAKYAVYFNDKDGIEMDIAKGWDNLARVLMAISMAYALFKLVDVVEYYLNKLTSRSETTLDDMLVPIIRKALRLTITVIAILIISENILGEGKIKSLLLSAGVGGIAIALAAKDTIANFFGSITIFADRPFQMGEMIKVGEHCGPVEEVGIRSTRIRTLQGHLVTVPNNEIANTQIENISRRPFIRRNADITITYDSGAEKAEQAVKIIHRILADVEEINTDPDRPPRVYFDKFNDCSLNIYMSYWVKPPDYWVYQEVNQRVNLEMMRQFSKAGIEFAFPTQTLYMKKEDEN